MATFEAEQVITYRELVRLQQQLTEEVVRYKNEIHALLVVLFPEFSQVFADPSKPTALAVLKAYPSAQALREAQPEDVYRLLHELCPRHYGRKTAAKLVQLAQMSVSSGQAVAARSSSLRILCDSWNIPRAISASWKKRLIVCLTKIRKAKGCFPSPNWDR